MKANALNTITVMLAVSTGHALAAGFQSTTHSAAGVGRANAGEAVIADNASVLARNPAAIMRFNEPILTAGFNLVMPTTDVTDASANTSFALPDPSADMPDEEVTSLKPSPHLYYIHPFSRQIAVGAAVYSNFATGTDFSTGFNESGVLSPAAPAAGGLVGGKTDVTTINFNFSVAGRVIDSLSLGAGLDVMYGDGKFERFLIIGGTDRGQGLDFEGDGWSVGWNAGLMYEFNDRNRFGLSYHSGMSFTAEGDGSFRDESFDETKLDLPARAEFSGYHQVADAWAVHYSLQWIGWSAFDKIDFGGLTEKVYNWDNSGRYAIGTTYTIGKAWTWRAGLAFDESPVPEEYRTISIPDSNRIWYSTGATWKSTSEHHMIDMAFTYLQGEELEVNETALDEPIPIVVNAKTETNALILGTSYSYQF